MLHSSTDVKLKGFLPRECCNSALVGLYYCLGLLAEQLVSYLAECRRSLHLVKSFHDLCTFFLSLLSFNSVSWSDALDFTIKLGVMFYFLSESSNLLRMGCPLFFTLNLLLCQCRSSFFEVWFIVKLRGLHWLTDLGNKPVDVGLVIGGQFLWKQVSWKVIGTYLANLQQEQLHFKFELEQA